MTKRIKRCTIEHKGIKIRREGIRRMREERRSVKISGSDYEYLKYLTKRTMIPITKLIHIAIRQAKYNVQTDNDETGRE